ncbi:hypothetical protein L195_g064614, partial [Trifolium pratense]
MGLREADFGTEVGGGSLWWREIVGIREGGGEPGGRWFGEHVVRRVGDESEIFSGPIPGWMVL